MTRVQSDVPAASRDAAMPRCSSGSGCYPDERFCARCGDVE